MDSFFVPIYLFIYKNLNNMILDARIHKILQEELTKNDVNSIVNSKIDSALSSRDFKKTVKELASDVINELFKQLWQKNTLWKNAVAR